MTFRRDRIEDVKEDNVDNTNMKSQISKENRNRETALERDVRKLLVLAANLALNSDAVQIINIRLL